MQTQIDLMSVIKVSVRNQNGVWSIFLFATNSINKYFSIIYINRLLVIGNKLGSFRISIYLYFNVFYDKLLWEYQWPIRTMNLRSWWSMFKKHVSQIYVCISFEEGFIWKINELRDYIEHGMLIKINLIVRENDW